MQKLLVYQSTWAMERRRPDGCEWTLDEKLRMIRDAGFDGLSMALFDLDEARVISEFLAAHGMGFEAQVFPKTVDDLKPAIEHAERLGAHHIDMQPDIRPYHLEEAVALVHGWQRLAEQTRIPIYVETHRDRLTTDMFFTLHLLDCLPDLRLTADISHYYVGREFAWPVSAENHALMHRILDKSWNFHGRVASREQVQIQISFPCHRENVDLFMGWWDYGFRSWRGRAGADAELVFLCELGPPEYAIRGPDGYELSDRWEEAQMMRDEIREMWRRIEAEDGKNEGGG